MKKKIQQFNNKAASLCPPPHSITSSASDTPFAVAKFGVKPITPAQGFFEDSKQLDTKSKLRK